MDYGVTAATKQRNFDIQNTLIIIFTRFPVGGQVKTRLTPFIGTDKACELQKSMTEYTVRQAFHTGCPLQIRYTGGTESQMKEWLGVKFEFKPQGEGDLGERMARAFEEGFAKGAKKVLVTGCDCPDNRTANMLNAVKMLDSVSCVIGPALDGGYYLIGLNKPNPGLFYNIAWGTESVLKQTLAKINEYRLLPVLNDVDKVEDIPRKISVIIPALNEEKLIGNAVKSALNGFNTEVIVVDGGSTDSTREIASRKGAKVLSTASGRASQMNFGARQAAGDILVFLHGDSWLPEAWDYYVRGIIKKPETALGFFRFAIKESFPFRRLIEWGTNLRSRFLNLPYGDQGLFFTKNVFFTIGGYPEIPILEDVKIVSLAKKHGNIRCTDITLTTSGRRWIRQGAFRTTFINQAVLLSAWLGVDQRKLRDDYCAGTNPLLTFFRRRN